MRYLVVLCCVLAASTAAKNTKISLEDIERDNLRGSNLAKTITPPPQKGSGSNSPPTYGFVPAKTVQDYQRKQPKYVQYVPPQQYVAPPAQQVPQQQYYYQQPVGQGSPYQQYENIQYVTDNSIAQPQYYTPQYVYLQQYTAPSTAVQSVVDPKGGIQYIMYLPSYTPKAEQTQNYENVVYVSPQSQQSYVVPETQYVSQREVTPSVKYVETESPKTQPAQVFTQREPKSLLDSYVPSILQVQYYKQQQARANAIQQSAKEVSSQIPGKGDYRTTHNQNNAAESILSYNYQIPSTLQKYN